MHVHFFMVFRFFNPFFVASVFNLMFGDLLDYLELF
ncbi:hypothetical protein T01_9887 [Trichinella spiralis]|nr:hypothetical protein T01_9887 [Trichinella spiralis]